MGYDATSYLPPRTVVRSLQRLLSYLGYSHVHRDRRTPEAVLAHFVFYKDGDYRHYDGVVATLRRATNQQLELDTRTSASCSRADMAVQNRTLREVRDRFGGHFVSDSGRNRYLRFEGIDRTPADAGCFLAYSRFGHNLLRARLYLQFRKFEGAQWQETGQFSFLDDMNPRLLSNNLLLPYLVATLEDYFKSTYVALLRFSDRKAVLLKAARLSGEDMAAISDGRASLEEAVAASMSFQSLTHICTHFRDLLPRFDLAGVLRKPYRRRKESLYESLARLVESRHRLIHRAIVDIEYTDENVLRDLYSLEAAVTRIYKALLARHGWEYELTWSLGK